MRGSLCIIAVGVWLLMSIACTHRAPSERPQVWQLRGAVVDVQRLAIQIRHKTGQRIVLIIDDQTQILNHTLPVSLERAHVGARVMVDVLRVKTTDRAIRITIY